MASLAAQLFGSIIQDLVEHDEDEIRDMRNRLSELQSCDDLSDEEEEEKRELEKEIRDIDY